MTTLDDHGIARTWSVIATEQRTCTEHGGYESRQMELSPSKAPTWLKQHWTNCPDCNAIWQREADNAEREARGGATLREELRQQRRTEAGVPRRFAEATVWNWAHGMPAQATIWHWVRDYTHALAGGTAGGRSAALIGHTGTGKTHLAIGVLAHLLDHGRTGVYTTVMDLLSSVKATYHRAATTTEAQVMARFTGADLLVIDEVGKALDTAYETAQLFRVLDTRYRELRPTILVSNLGPKGLAEFLGEPVMDRIRDNGGRVLSFGWGTHRGRTTEETS